MTHFEELFTASMNEKKGLLLFVNGQSVAGLVTKICDDGFLELRSQQYSCIQVRINQIDAVAMA